jgi:AraC-like DNA-binding protein
MRRTLILENTSFVTKLFQLKEFISIFLTFFLSIDIILKFYLKSKTKISENAARHKWAKSIFILSALIVLLWSTSYVYGFFVENFSRKMYYPIWCLSTFVICFAGWYGFMQKGRSQKPDGATTDPQSLLTIIDSEDKIQLQKLQQITVNLKLYKHSKITVKEFSEHSGISSSRITKLLRKNNENFNSFINRYRVEEAKRLLLEQDYFRYTMDFICEEAGFNSRASFFNIFKVTTGKTPKQYREEMASLLHSQEKESSPKEGNLV